MPPHTARRRSIDEEPPRRRERDGRRLQAVEPPAPVEPRASAKAAVETPPRPVTPIDPSVGYRDPASERRTVRISGQVPARSRRRAEPPVSRFAGHPDTPARWAVALGIFMVVMAVITGDPGS